MVFRMGCVCGDGNSTATGLFFGPHLSIDPWFLGVWMYAGRQAAASASGTDTLPSQWHNTFRCMSGDGWLQNPVPCVQACHRQTAATGIRSGYSGEYRFERPGLMNPFLDCGGSLPGWFFYLHQRC